jgi:hypothetical protein
VFGSLEYCVGAPECYFSVSLFEEVGDLPNLSAVIGEGGQFFVLVVFSWCSVLQTNMQNMPQCIHRTNLQKSHSQIPQTHMLHQKQ